MMTVPLLFTNAVATALVGMRYWRYRRDIKPSFNNWIKTTTVERVLALLVESGFVYCIIWAVYIATKFIKGGESGLTGFSVFRSAYHNISGIYPCLIVIVIGMQRDENEMESMDLPSTPISQPLYFASEASGPLRSAGERELQSRGARDEDTNNAMATRDTGYTCSETRHTQSNSSAQSASSSQPARPSGDPERFPARSRESAVDISMTVMDSTSRPAEKYAAGVAKHSSAPEAITTGVAGEKLQ